MLYNNEAAPMWRLERLKKENCIRSAVFCPQYTATTYKSQSPRRLARRLAARGMLRLALLAATAGEQLARAALRLECEA